jgi:hypothetical protein
MLKAAFVPDVISQHFPGNHFGVPSRFLIPWQLIALGIGDSLAPPHNDMEKGSRHTLEVVPQLKDRKYQNVPTFPFFEAKITAIQSTFSGRRLPAYRFSIQTWSRSKSWASWRCQTMGKHSLLPSG